MLSEIRERTKKINLMSGVVWLIAFPFVALGWVGGKISLFVRFIIAAAIVGFNRATNVNS